MWIHPTPEEVVQHNEVRVAQLRREIAVRRHVSGRRPVRRWVGRQLMRAGDWLAADPSLRPARSH